MLVGRYARPRGQDRLHNCDCVPKITRIPSIRRPLAAADRDAGETHIGLVPRRRVSSLGSAGERTTAVAHDALTGRRGRRTASRDVRLGPAAAIAVAIAIAIA